MCITKEAFIDFYLNLQFSFLNPIQDDLFRGFSRMVAGQKGPPSLKSVPHTLK